MKIACLVQPRNDESFPLVSGRLLSSNSEKKQCIQRAGTSISYSIYASELFIGITTSVIVSGDNDLARVRIALYALPGSAIPDPSGSVGEPLKRRPGRAEVSQSPLVGRNRNLTSTFRLRSHRLHSLRHDSLRPIVMHRSVQ